jgi:hypothetical protein
MDMPWEKELEQVQMSILEIFDLYNTIYRDRDYGHPQIFEGTEN